jgi:hypothetical protein
VDASGNVFAVGRASSKATVRRLSAGQAAFSTVYQAPFSTINFLAGMSGVAPGQRITVVDTGPAAGVYVVGTGSNAWKVIKSGDSGASWSQVDSFQYEAGRMSQANAVVGDASGNVYVVGDAQKSTVVGQDAKRRPIYQNVSHWLVRKSANGGATWTTADDFQLSSVKNAFPYAVGIDLAGNVYAAGGSVDSAGREHAVIRTSSGGAWSTSDDFLNPGFKSYYTAMTTDSVTGTLYAGGNWYPWFIRSAPGPVSPLANSGAFATLPVLDMVSLPDGDVLDLPRVVDDVLA